MGGARLNLRVAAFTGGLAVPSARFRVRQFTVPLAQDGITIREMGWGGGGLYPPAATWRKPLWAAGRIAALVPDVLRSRQYDAVLLQRELLSSFATLEHLTGRPRVFDVDDSIHLLRGGHFARRISASCDHIIAGNAYLAEWYRQWNRHVSILPTAIDTVRYAPAASQPGPLQIGWVGTSANFPYLKSIEPALRQVLAECPDLRFLVMADYAPALSALDPDRWSFQKWSEDAEVGFLQSLDIGLMPLPDDPWTRGKCSFKMLQYMACGLPVVVSPVGMNAEVLARGEIGCGASSSAEWIEALLALARSENLRKRLGQNGRKIVENHYSVSAIAPQLAKILRGC